MIDRGHLEAFAAVIDEGSFEAAALRLHVTPSAISQRIKALEAQLGQIVVARTRPTQPTAAGRALVRLANQVALLESEIVAELGGPGSAAGTRVPIAVNADSLTTWFLPALATLPAELSLTFTIHQEDQDHSIALLRDGTVMAAVTTEAQPVQGCRVRALGAMRYLAVASAEFGQRYFFDRDVELKAGLSSAPALVFNRKDGLQHRFIELLTGDRLDPPITYLPSSHGFAEAARLGIGWGMVPEQMARPYLDDGQLIEVAPGHGLDVPLYWQRWRLDSQSLDSLTNAVTSGAADVLQQSPDLEAPGR
jgi:LysR family transcriptional regulator (chromosome initiation inhibitor)